MSWDFFKNMSKGKVPRAYSDLSDTISDNQLLNTIWEQASLNSQEEQRRRLQMQQALGSIHNDWRRIMNQPITFPDPDQRNMPSLQEQIRRLTEEALNQAPGVVLTVRKPADPILDKDYAEKALEKLPEKPLPKDLLPAAVKLNPEQVQERIKAHLQRV